jgi:hypothetical protein
MIKRYGDVADVEAARRTDEYEAKGERDGQRVWLSIMRAIEQLRKVQPGRLGSHAFVGATACHVRRSNVAVNRP